MNNIRSISKYVYGEIKKVVNGNKYQIGYITMKHCSLFDGNPDKKVLENNGFSTGYILYVNNKFECGPFGYNLTKEEVLNKLDELIEYYEKRNTI